MTDEPLLDADDIQGHIVPGYGPGNLCLLAVAAESGDAARAFLRALVPHVTTMRAALAERAERKAFRKGMAESPVDRRSRIAGGGDPDGSAGGAGGRAPRGIDRRSRIAGGGDPDGSAGGAGGRAPRGIDRLHVHVALTRSGLDRLGHEQRGVDRAFDAGMTGLSTGDCKCAVRPDGTRERAHPSNWYVGGPGTRFDILAMFIASHGLEGAMGSLRAQLAAIDGIRVVYEEHGADLPERREHFGFLDGISGPGLYGEYEDDGARIPVTTRYGVPPHNGREFGRPGQPLVWPGRFIVGLPRARGEASPAPHPIWQNGSFLVFRRLEQDVAAFHADTDAMAGELAPQIPGITGELVRTLIIGRRRNGQPLMRAGDGPDSPLALNHFMYQTAAPAITLTDGTAISAASRDVSGAICPFWSHIRKVNPRDGINDLSTDAADLQLLRRGVPFGPPYDHDAPDAPINREPRGLLFLAYQSDIHEHFENLSSHWMNQFDQPAGGGHDLLAGVALDPTGQLGPRRAEWPGSTAQLVAHRHWVVPTGGAYLFAPSRSAIALLVNPAGPAAPAGPAGPAGTNQNS